jgi:glycerophosphoryl diester phosphodiesterase
VSKQINIQGHRGARGLYPENTLRGFIEAVKLGVNAIELDVVISADKKVVVSHEAWMNEDFCSLPDGTPVEKGTGKNYNLYKMRYTEIKKFDCGKMANAEFPMQMAIPSYKPLLNEVITYVELYTKENNLSPVSYNIELKTEPEDELFSPPPGMFVDLVHDELSKHQLDDRIQIQSFDVRLLRELKKKDASIRIGLLVENYESLETNIERLGFIPATYSPEFFLVTSTLVSEVHRQDMKIIPWTVNEQEDMLRLLSLGVDGIITDYPNRLIELTKRNTIN